MKKLFVVSSIVAMMFSSVSHAELLEADYLSKDDSLVTLDTKTGLEWLDLSQTMGKSIDWFEQSEFKSNGWRIATQSEAVDLYLNYKYDGNTFKSMFGTQNGTIGYSYGLYDLGNGYYSMSGLYNTNVGYTQYGSFNSFYSRGDFGIWLVSDGGVSLSSKLNPAINTPGYNGTVEQVPLTGSFILMSMGIIGLSRKRKLKA